jgi:hypothetical protein
MKYYAVGKSDDKSDDAKTVSLAGLVTTHIPRPNGARFLRKFGAAIATISRRKHARLRLAEAARQV